MKLTDDSIDWIIPNNGNSENTTTAPDLTELTKF